MLDQTDLQIKPIHRWYFLPGSKIGVASFLGWKKIVVGYQYFINGVMVNENILLPVRPFIG